MSKEKDSKSNPPEQEQFLTALKALPSHGCFSAVARRLGKSRTFLMNHYFGENNKDGGVFFESVFGLWLLAEEDPDGFAAIVAYFNSLFAEWSEPNGEEDSLDQLIAAALNHLSDLVALKSQRGTKDQQLVSASKLTATTQTITAKLDDEGQTRFRRMESPS
jgi:cell division protein ZapA (FtsZ GTPase activity inhibitor)